MDLNVPLGSTVYFTASIGLQIGQYVHMRRAKVGVSAPRRITACIVPDVQYHYMSLARARLHKKTQKRQTKCNIETTNTKNRGQVKVTSSRHRVLNAKIIDQTGS